MCGTQCFSSSAILNTFIFIALLWNTGNVSQRSISTQSTNWGHYGKVNLKVRSGISSFTLADQRFGTLIRDELGINIANKLHHHKGTLLFRQSLLTYRNNASFSPIQSVVAEPELNVNANKGTKRLALVPLPANCILRNSTKQRKWASNRICYYNNSSSTFSLLLKCGDIQANPGPNANIKTKTGKQAASKPVRHTSAPLCSQCTKSVRRNQKRFVCEMCKDFTHFRCASVSFFTIKNIRTDMPCVWTCPACTLSQLPFYGQRQLDLSELSDTTPAGNDEHLNALQERNHQLKIMHLNTQGVVSTFDSFLLAVNRYSFDIITLSETWLKQNELLLQHVTIPGYVYAFNHRDKKNAAVWVYMSKKLSSLKDLPTLKNVSPPWNTCGLKYLVVINIASSCWVLFTDLSLSCCTLIGLILLNLSLATFPSRGTACS